MKNNQERTPLQNKLDEFVIEIKNTFNLELAEEQKNKIKEIMTNMFNNPSRENFVQQLDEADKLEITRDVRNKVALLVNHIQNYRDRYVLDTKTQPSAKTKTENQKSAYLTLIQDVGTLASSKRTVQLLTEVINRLPDNLSNEQALEAFNQSYNHAEIKGYLGREKVLDEIINRVRKMDVQTLPQKNTASTVKPISLKDAELYNRTEISSKTNIMAHLIDKWANIELQVGAEGIKIIGPGSATGAVTNALMQLLDEQGKSILATTPLYISDEKVQAINIEPMYCDRIAELCENKELFSRFSESFTKKILDITIEKAEKKIQSYAQEHPTTLEQKKDEMRFLITALKAKKNNFSHEDILSFNTEFNKISKTIEAESEARENKTRKA